MDFYYGMRALQVFSAGMKVNARKLLAFALMALVSMVGAESAAAADSITLSTTNSYVDPGSSVELSGNLISPEGAFPAGTQVALEQSNDEVNWTVISNTTSGTDGSWSFAVKPAAPALFRARAVNTRQQTFHSPSVSLGINRRLNVNVSRKPQRSYSTTRVRITATYPELGGVVRLSVIDLEGKRIALVKRNIPTNGKPLALKIPTDSIGKLTVIAAATKVSQKLSPASAQATVKLKSPSLAVGSTGPHVTALVRRLHDLGYVTPSLNTRRFNSHVGDSVLAFHKYHRMTRSYSVSAATWRKLAKAKPVKAKYRTKGTHIEVDKTRQILMVVKNGKPLGAFHVSTGATGNTPVGRFKVYQRGGSYLYRFMAFKGNFGIHGYSPVPAFPASHGCVREPMWIANWTWKNTKKGTVVRIYNS